MFLKYWLSTEGGFVGGERVNPVGVLVSGGLPWCPMSGIVTGGNVTAAVMNQCSVMFAAVMLIDCVVVWAAAVNFGWFVEDASAAVVWAAAAVLADVLVLAVAAAVLAAVYGMMWLNCLLLHRLLWY